jgi:hypothetical protein
VARPAAGDPASDPIPGHSPTGSSDSDNSKSVHERLLSPRDLLSPHWS